ncbi:MAG: hypothetical protein J7605_02675 [Variovorax sp.]|nr:hypothetical protein [Variovorax sp.]
MSWMITASGAEYHFTGYEACTESGRPVRIEDIAHQLAQINRFCGATKRPYSVAEHSLLVSEFVQRDGRGATVQLAALLHDAHEIYTNDVSSPAKQAINLRAVQSGGTQAWRQFEREHEDTVRRHFGVQTTFSAHRLVLQHFDLVALATERRDLLNWTPASARWEILRDGQPGAIPPADWLTLDCPHRAGFAWTDWRDAFLGRFQELTFFLKGQG